MAELAIGLIGPGLVGKSFLSQIQQQGSLLKSPLGVSLKVCGIANSRTMILARPSSPAGLEMSTWQEELAKGQPFKIQDFLDKLAQYAAFPVLVDCSASARVPQAYASWLAHPHCSIVTPNKQLGAGPLSQYQEVSAACRQTGNQFFYEATVGAGLPVISTLQGLLNTGDQVKSIEGILSGTLSYIFNNFGPGRRFSEVVTQAKAAGYTEPDPREDLSGMDVARKVVILARECGIHVNLEDVEIESLVAPQLQQTPSSDAFLKGLPEFDRSWEEKAEAASKNGDKLCYVGLIDMESRSCRAVLKSYPSSHPFAQLQGADNIVSFRTRRYSEQPLFVRGPGAGAEVTAAGVFSDVLLLARSLGARF